MVTQSFWPTYESSVGWNTAAGAFVPAHSISTAPASGSSIPVNVNTHLQSSFGHVA